MFLFDLLSIILGLCTVSVRQVPVFKLLLWKRNQHVYLYMSFKLQPEFLSNKWGASVDRFLTIRFETSATRFVFFLTNSCDFNMFILTERGEVWSLEGCWTSFSVSSAVFPSMCLLPYSRPALHLNTVSTVFHSICSTVAPTKNPVVQGKFIPESRIPSFQIIPRKSNPISIYPPLRLSRSEQEAIETPLCVFFPSYFWEECCFRSCKWTRTRSIRADYYSWCFLPPYRESGQSRWRTGIRAERKAGM